MNHTPSWTSNNLVIRTLVQEVNNKYYNLDPEHQRNVVHTVEWKRELISSIFDYGVIPPPFWHQRNGIYESLDGKQRVSAIVQFHNNEFTWNGKLFSQLPVSEQVRFENTKITFIMTDSTLTSEQIGNLFAKFQVTKKTSAGELVNSITDNFVTNKIRHIIQHHTFDKYFDAKFTARHHHTDMIFQAFYLFDEQNQTIIDGTNIEKFLCQYSCARNQDPQFILDCENRMNNASKLLKIVLDIVGALKASTSRGIWCPVFLFLRNDFQNGKNLGPKQQFLTTNLRKIIESNEWKANGHTTKVRMMTRTKLIQRHYNYTKKSQNDSD